MRPRLYPRRGRPVQAKDVHETLYRTRFLSDDLLVFGQDGVPGGRLRHRSKAVRYSSTLTSKTREIFSASFSERFFMPRSISRRDDVVISAFLASSG